MLRDFANVGLFLFLILSFFLAGLYLFFLYDKISHPGFKNLSVSAYVLIGFGVVLMVIADAYILRRFRRWWKGKSI